MSVSLNESVPGLTRTTARSGRTRTRAARLTVAGSAPSPALVEPAGSAAPASASGLRSAGATDLAWSGPSRRGLDRGWTSAARWWPPSLVMASVLVAGGLNAAAIGAGQRPGWLGMTASVFFLASWVGYLAATRRTHRHAALRRLNACWAGIIAGSALTASVVGLELSPIGGQLVEGVLAVISFLLAAPLYGLTGLIGGEHFPLGMAGLAVACYLGLLAFAVAGLHVKAPESAERSSRRP